MALPRLRSTTNGGSSEPDPVVDLPRLADDPEVIRLTELKNTLCRARDARDALLQIRSIDAQLRGGGTSQRGPRADFLRERRLALLASLPGPSEARPARDDDGLHPDIRLGLRLTRGEQLPEDPDSSGEAARLQREMSAIDAAMRLVDGQFDELRAERSADIARDLWEQHRSILQSKFQAAMALCAASAAERAMIAAMINAGYQPCPGVLMSPKLAAADALGDVERADSPICRYRQALELAGVL